MYGRDGAWYGRELLSNSKITTEFKNYDCQED